MKLFNKVVSVWQYLLSASIGGLLLFFGSSRISTGIRSMGIENYYMSHYMNVGLGYIYLSVLILVVVAYRLAKVIR